MASLPHGEEPGDGQDIRLVVDTIPTLAWSARPDGSAEFFNQRWLDYTGLSAEQALGSGWQVAIHSDDLPRILETFQEALNSVKPYEVEGRFRRFDGEFRWFLFRGSPLRDRSGKVAKWYGTNTDLEERKRAEEALRKSEERWRAVFENSAIGVALTDQSVRFLATNSAFQKMLGYTEEEIGTLTFLELTHEDYRESNWQLVTELFEGKRRQFQIEKQYRRKDGSLIWVRNNVSLVPGTESMARFIMALSEDITERKEAEEALHSSEERVRLILDSTAEAIFGCDPEGACLFCNPAAVRLLGFDDPSELLGKNMHALEHHTRKDGTPFPIDECPIYLGFHENRGVHIDDDIFWRKDGTSFPVEYWSHPMLRDGKTVGAVITFFDITERKRAEETLRQSEQRKCSLLEINNAI